MFPSIDAAVVDGFADLLDTRRGDGALGLVEVFAAVVPGKAEEGDEALGFLLGVFYEVFVVYFQEGEAEGLFPVGHDFFVEFVEVGEVGEGVFEFVADVEVGHEAGEAGVEGVSFDVDDAGAGEGHLDEAEVGEVEGHFVGDADGVGRGEGDEAPEVVGAELIDLGLGEGGEAVGVVASAVGIAVCGADGGEDHFVGEFEFAGAVDGGVGGEDLFDEGGTGAGHADDEDGAVGEGAAFGEGFEAIFGEEVEEAGDFAFGVGGVVGGVFAGGVAVFGGGEGLFVVAGAVVECGGGEVDVGVFIGDAVGEELVDDVEGLFFGFEFWGRVGRGGGQGGGDGVSCEECLCDLPGGIHFAGGFEDPGAGFEDGGVIGGELKGGGGVFEGLGDHAFAEEPFAEPGVGDGGVGGEFDGAAERSFGFAHTADAHLADADGPIEVPFEGVGAGEECVGVACAEDIALGEEGAGAIELGFEGCGVRGDPGSSMGNG